MRDLFWVAGSAVRHRDGRQGQVRSTSWPWVRVAWPDGSSEAMLRSDPRIDEDFEICTIDRGWVPLGRVVGAKHRRPRPVAESVALLEDFAELLDEASVYYPFKRNKRLGPGPRGSRHAATGGWVCKCGNYRCTCVRKKNPGKGQKKTVTIDKDYKQAYNSEFKAWRKKRAAKKKKKVAKKSSKKK